MPTRLNSRQILAVFVAENVLVAPRSSGAPPAAGVDVLYHRPSRQALLRHLHVPNVVTTRKLVRHTGTQRSGGEAFCACRLVKVPTRSLKLLQWCTGRLEGQ